MPNRPSPAFVVSPPDGCKQPLQNQTALRPRAAQTSNAREHPIQTNVLVTELEGFCSQFSLLVAPNLSYFVEQGVDCGDFKIISI